MTDQERRSIIATLLEIWNLIDQAELTVYGAIEGMGVDPSNPPQFQDPARQRVACGLVELVGRTDGLIAGIINLLRELGYAGEEDFGDLPPERRQGHGPLATEALLCWAQAELDRHSRGVDDSDE